MDFQESTITALIDVKVLLDRVLYDDNYHNTLSINSISRKDVEEIWKDVENIIYVHKIPYEAQSELPYSFNTTDDEGAMNTLNAAYELLVSIDDPWLWAEEEYAMTDIIDGLKNILDLE